MVVTLTQEVCRDMVPGMEVLSLQHVLTTEKKENETVSLGTTTPVPSCEGNGRLG